jgi:hypothetical protein
MVRRVSSRSGGEVIRINTEILARNNKKKKLSLLSKERTGFCLALE